MTLLISTILPRMTTLAFDKIIKAAGATRYNIVTNQSIVIFSSSKSRSDRKEMLMSIAKGLENYGAQYSSGGASGAGFVAVGRAKILAKPEAVAGGLILKPNIFGTNASMVDKNIPYDSYYSSLIGAIQDTKKLDAIQKDVLTTIVNYTAAPTPTNKAELRRVMTNMGSCISLSTINNDFGELLGPIAIMTKGLLPIDAKTATVFIPSRSNEPLLDYKITDANREYKISAKSGESTNTLKPSDVVALIDESDFYKDKWGKTPQYHVLQILTDGSVRQGPINAGIWLKRNGFDQYFEFLKSQEYSEETRQLCENAIVRISREALDFTQIFADATTSKVYYVKFRMNNVGDTEWKLVETPQDKEDEKIAKKRVVFRSKNFVGRAKDKLGFQV